MRPIHIFQATLVALGLGAATASATTSLDAAFGTPTGGGTTRSLAMGSTGVALRAGSDALFFNPGALVPEAGKLHLDFAAGLTQANEDRLVPLFDTFQSFVTETIVSLNRNTYASASGGATYRLGTNMPLAIGAGIFDRYDFDYDYFDEFRDPNAQNTPRDQVLAVNEIAQSGRLRSFSVGFSGAVLEQVHVGLSMHRYFGDLSREVTTDSVQTGRHEIDEVDQSLGGWGWSVGGWGRVNDRVDLGVSYEGAFTVDGDRDITHSSGRNGVDSTRTATTKQSIDYPGTLRLGLVYHPRNRLRTTFEMDLERRFWESLDEPVVGALGDSITVRDTWDFRIGLEHVFYNDLPVRFGFRYLENYADSESERSIYSAGLGYRVGGWALDLTGLFIRQTSRQGFLFNAGALAPLVPGGTEKVEDTVVQAVFGVSRAF